jgi:hypothetical protein
MGHDRSSHASPRQHYRPGTARHRGVSKVRKVKAHGSGRTKLLQKQLHELSRIEHDRTPKQPEYVHVLLNPLPVYELAVGVLGLQSVVASSPKVFG